MADDEMKAEAAAEGESEAMERKEHKRRRRGGKAEGEGDGKVQVYNAAGSAAMDSAKDETPGFKHGGHKKRRDGGMADGAMAGGRLDRRPRRAAGGRTPYSSASAMTGPTDNQAAKGFEGAVHKP